MVNSIKLAVPNEYTELAELLLAYVNALRPSDAYMRQ